MQIYIIPRTSYVRGNGEEKLSSAPDTYRLHMSQHELDELYSSLLVSDSPVAQSIASNLSKYAKKVSFR